MANLPSAKKRIKQNEKNRERNRARRSAVKTQTRKLVDALTRSDTATAEKQFVVLTKKLDQVAAKGTLHKNTVARRKSRLARRLNAVRAKKPA